jgi:transcriptional regulator with XRE-family HTH domain
MPYSSATTGTFALVAVHVGNLLKELYEQSGLKREAFAERVHYAVKTLDYHFSQEDLNTAILKKYAEGLGVDLFGLISRKDRGYTYGENTAQSATSEPFAQDPRMGEAAELLRQAAQVLERKP